MITLTDTEINRVLDVLDDLSWLKDNKHNYHTKEYMDIFDSVLEYATEVKNMLEVKEND